MTNDERWQDMSARLDPEQAHHQSWYAVALASDVAPGEVIGRDFLNTRVAIYRNERGEPVVLTSRCPHMGADLALGDIVGDDLRCTYHHFCFGPSGHCTSIPTEGDIPPSARVFSYPSAEHLGLIWAFNGETPLFGLPEIRDYSPDDLVVRARKTNVFTVAPWVNVANTVDFMHLRYVHDLDFDFDLDKIRWLDGHHMEYEIVFGSPELGRFEQRIRVTGPNTTTHVTVAESSTTAAVFTSTPIGDVAQSYYVSTVEREEGASEEVLESRLAEQEAFGDGLLADDSRTLTGIDFKVGSFVKEDRAYAKFLRWVHEMPRARFGDAPHHTRGGPGAP